MTIIHVVIFRYLCVVAVLINHGLWFEHFLKRQCGHTEVITFYLMMIWLTPLCFLLSMSSSTQGLPNFGTSIKSYHNISHILQLKFILRGRTEISWLPFSRHFLPNQSCPILNIPISLQFTINRNKSNCEMFSSHPSVLHC